LVVAVWASSVVIASIHHVSALDLGRFQGATCEDIHDCRDPRAVAQDEETAKAKAKLDEMLEQIRIRQELSRIGHTPVCRTIKLDETYSETTCD
jgi:hypothetical protein